MPRDVTAIQSNLDSGRRVSRGALLLVLDSGSYGFWSGAEPWVFNGVTYVAAGRMISLRISTAQTIDGSSQDLEVSLSSVPNSSLTPDVLASIEAEQYKNRPVRLYEAFFNPDTRALISVRARFAGVISTFRHEVTPGGEYKLIGHFMSRSVDHQRIGGAVRNHEQQLLIDAADGGFFLRVATAGNEVIAWGRKPSTASRHGGNRGDGRRADV